MKEKIYKYNKLEGYLETIPKWVVCEMEQDIRRRYFREVGIWTILLGLTPFIFMIILLIDNIK